MTFRIAAKGHRWGCEHDGVCYPTSDAAKASVRDYSDAMQWQLYSCKSNTDPHGVVIEIAGPSGKWEPVS